MVFFLRWMLYCYFLFRTSGSDLSCSANRACSTMRNVTCRFNMVEPYDNVTHLTQRSIPSSPICHNITVVQHRNDSAVLLNVTWSGPADGSVVFLQGFLLSVMSSDSIYPKVMYHVDLRENTRLFKNETLFNKIRRGVFNVMCNYKSVRNEQLDFYIRSLPSPEDGNNNFKECRSILHPSDYSTRSPFVTAQNSSTTGLLVTAQNRSNSERIKTLLSKQEVHRKWNIVLILAASALVCSLIVVVITLTIRQRRRRRVIQSNSETESESGPSVDSVSPLCVSIKQIAPKSSDSVTSPERRISHVNSFEGLSSGQNEDRSDDSIFDEEIVQDMIRINFPDKTDRHGQVNLVE